MVGIRAEDEDGTDGQDEDEDEDEGRTRTRTTRTTTWMRRGRRHRQYGLCVRLSRLRLSRYGLCVRSLLTCVAVWNGSLLKKTGKDEDEDEGDDEEEDRTMNGGITGRSCLAAIGIQSQDG